MQKNIIYYYYLLCVYFKVKEVFSKGQLNVQCRTVQFDV